MLRNVMHGLYAPHQPHGASAQGPDGIVTCTVLMRKQLQRWRTLLAHTAGVSVKRALLRREVETPPSAYYVLCSDACFRDELSPTIRSA